MTRFFQLAIVAASLSALVACSDTDARPRDGSPTVSPSPAFTATPNKPESTPPSEPSPAAALTESQAGALARQKLAQWLGPAGNPDAVLIRDTRKATWNDACLGLSLSGEVCAQVITEGYRVEVELGNAVYEIRMDADGNVVRWAPETLAMVRFVEASTNSTVFSTDDGGTLQAQPINGTTFAVRPENLAKGDPVAVGLARAPQRDSWLLVWLDESGS
ncbi:MAG: hypothetical protein AB7J35_11465 [Dehalococcoidia bacterium]